MECLKWSLDKFGSLSFAALRDIAHQERAWIAAAQNTEMSYALMIEDDVPNRESLIEHLIESAPYTVF